MGALPVKKLTKSRQGKRLSHYKLSPVTYSNCTECGTARLPHRVCPNCGSYKGRRVFGEEET